MSKIKLLLDANLSPETADFLRKVGFEVKSVQEEGKLSVIWLRVKDQRVETVNEVLGKFFESLGDERIEESLVVISERKYKIVRW